MPPAPALTPTERAELTDLAAGYGFALDLRRWDDLRTVFAEDAVIDYARTVEHTGIEAIVRFFRETASTVAATQHLMHTSLLSATGPDTAEGLIHVTAHHVAHGAELPAPAALVYSVTGTYRDRYRRTDGGWRITRRSLTLLTSVGDPDILRVH